ncbi:MAG TPA: hypothetical protein VGC77_06285 [Rhodopseudomonas sp.]|uniref:hypothetical protein n=1 Tax=Rhodopseudomonas sp. TaxID=1078 RepID=UPI002ED81CB1
MADVDDIPRHWSLASLAALAAIVAIPPWLCIGPGGAPWHLVVAGAVVWFLSVVAKSRIVRALRNPALPQPGSVAANAVLQGFVSAVELAAAAGYLAALSALAPFDWCVIDMVAFGVGAGSAEAGYVLWLGVFGPRPNEAELAAWVQGARVSWCVRYSVPVERLFALIGHTGSRGLIALSLFDAAPLALLWAPLAVVLFAITDGVAVYGHLQQWPWHDPTICRRAQSFFALMSVVEISLFAMASRG